MEYFKGYLNLENFSLYNQHKKMWDLVTYNLHKALPVSAYIDKTYKNHVIMFRGSDSSIPMIGGSFQ